MRKISIKIPGWSIVITALILTLGLTGTLVRASGRLNLPLSWILSPSGTSVDTDNNGVIDDVNAGIPSGVIAMWSGSYNNIPSGWQLCDGTNGTPDLRNKFVYGVNTSYGPGNDGDLATTGGTTTHSHTVNSHTHTVDPPSTISSQLTGQYSIYNEWHMILPTMGHTHTVDIAQFDSGSASPGTDTINHLPCYYKLAYIMKL